jgi:heat shock protein HslJ
MRILLTLPLLLAACAGTGEPPVKGTLATDPPSAIESEWRIAAIDGKPLDGPAPATLAFLGGRISGTTGCNRLMGSYSLASDRLDLSGLATTRMACPGPAMAQESRVTGALKGSFRVAGKDGGLTLTGDSGAPVVDLVRD